MLTNPFGRQWSVNQGNVIISGKTSGEMNSFASVIIGENGIFKGSLQADTIYVYGKLEGEITADSMEVFKEGEVVCSYLKVQNIKIHDGGLLRENVVVLTANAQPLKGKFTQSPSPKLHMTPDEDQSKVKDLLLTVWEKTNEHSEKDAPSSLKFYNSY